MLATGGSASDAIDASYNVIINEENASVNLNIYTDKYSSYSSEVTAVSTSKYYIKATNNNYNYSVKYYNIDGEYVWANATFYKAIQSGRSTYYYYTVEKVDGYSYLYVYMYEDGQEQGQEDNFYAKSTNKNVTSYYDTIQLNYRSSQLTISFTNFTTAQAGPGGMMEGNKDKKDFSTKGIKADNEIVISAGTITIESYDDSIHANNDNELENGETPTGNITITGGTINLRSNDDGLHADDVLLIDDGVINLTKSYEGLEGEYVYINGGEISVVSSDDGVNGKSTLKEAIVISGGEIYIFASGDGIDSNSQVSYDGILFSGGRVVVISTGNADSSIDSERGYKYTGGYVLAICKSGGMGNESTKASNFSSIGKSQTMSLTSGSYLTASNYVTLKMPTSLNALVIFLGDKSVSLSTSSSTETTLNSVGVEWFE